MCISPCPTCPRSGFKKINFFYVAYVKIKKIGIEISLFVIHFLSFCTAHKNVCFMKFCMNT
jgi:hypothetical protein